MRVLNWVLGVLFSLVLLIIFFGVGPWVESWLFPVYSRFAIVSMQATPTGTRAIFQYTKYRNCEALGYSWYNGDLGAGLKILNVKREGPNRPRPLGTQITAPINIEGVTPEELANQVNAVLYSRCHPLWITETVVRP